MRGILWIVALALAAVVASVVLLRRSSRGESGSRQARTHLVLIGASIGRAWNLPEWPARAGAREFTAEAMAVWQFDKTEAVEEVLLRPARKFRVTRTYLKSLFQPPPRAPSLVILKECSSYFPGDLPAQKQQTRAWIERLRQRGVPIMLATVVPVTLARAARYPGKQDSLLAYNRWIREYSREQGIPLLDLERAVSPDERGSHLPEEFATPDGTHLNAAGYAVLDRALLAALRGIPPGYLKTGGTPQPPVHRTQP